MMFGRRRAGTIGGVGVQQIIGVGGALTFANILKDLIFWTDMIRTILGGWAQFVQTWLWPVAAFLFGWVFELLQLELTAFWKDYLTIGLLFAAGFLRHFWLVVRRIDEEASADLEEYGGKAIIPFPIYMSSALRWAPLILTPLSIVAWPATLVLFAAMMVLSREDVRFVIYGLVSILLPLIYLALLIAVNELVLR
ncbi:hypothetical protein L2D00_00105 [Hyphomonadaceae bacterium BL14]|nr:hypothetical protein L2D00_00105 [Hyphomonadaceae bacterium BL14]